MRLYKIKIDHREYTTTSQTEAKNFTEKYPGGSMKIVRYNGAELPTIIFANFDQLFNIKWNNN